MEPPANTPPSCAWNQAGGLIMFTLLLVALQVGTPFIIADAESVVVPAAIAIRLVENVAGDPDNGFTVTSDGFPTEYAMVEIDPFC
jgi:hypothetical protein